jgi:hypothetical protein
MAHAAKEQGVIAQKVIAFEVRPRRFGFVVLEGRELVDWGVRGYGVKPATVGSIKKIESLLDFHQPHCIVVMDRGSRIAPTEPEKAVLEGMTALRSAASRREIKVSRVPAKRIRGYFAKHGCGTKHEIALAVARSFEPLAWKLPPRRKPWQREPYHALMFDAAATAMTFLNEPQFSVVSKAPQLGE